MNIGRTLLAGAFFALLTSQFSLIAQSTLIPAGAVWKYLDNGTDQGTAWRALDYDDSAGAGWNEGPAELGYGDGGEATVVGFGGNTAAKFATTYFRKKFVVNDPSIFATLLMDVTYDDGCIIYINGVQASRVRIPDDAVIEYNTYIGAGADYTPATVSAPASLLVAGTNIIAVEMHQSDGASSDMSFNLALRGNARPSVSITSPTENQQISGPTDVTIAANATDLEGAVPLVEFFFGGEPIGQATNSPYSVIVTNLGDGAYEVTARATDSDGATTLSTPVHFIVNDPAPPSLLSAFGTTNQVFVRFSKRLSLLTATNRNNYSLSGGAQIQSAVLSADLKVVTLTTSFLAVNQTFTLTVNNVTDLNGMAVAPNSQTSFTVQGYQPLDIGSPAVVGSSTPAGGGYDVRGGGTGFGGTSDQFHYNYETRSGDFDVQVRVQGLTLANAMTSAGLMAREALTPGTRFVAVVATPSMAGCFFQYRTNQPTGAAATTGFAPVNYPNTWLRLQRSNLTNFSGYASADGVNWIPLGKVSANLPANLFFGFAVSSRNTSTAATAQFRDFAASSGGTIASAILPFEPLGPSRRTGPIAITEIMYKPASNALGRVLDFIELYNSNPYVEDIGGYRISGDVDYTFPPGTVMQGGQFLVVAAAPADVQAEYGVTGVRGPWGKLSDPGSSNLTTEGTIRLRNKEDAVLLEIEYSNKPPWPVGADGTGHSLVLARPSYGENNPMAWAISDKPGGSPGGMDGYTATSLRNVVINEFLANSDSPEVDYIELYNHSNLRIDISGCGLSDEKHTNKFVFPAGTFIESNSFIHVTQLNLNFGLNSGGETIYFWAPGRVRLLDAVTFEAQAANVSSGRWPDGSADFYPLRNLTPGARNGAILIRDIVINEIMYKPISGQNDDEYVELYNKGTNSVNLSGWRFVAGIDFTFPPNTTLAPDAYLVVGRNVQQLLSHYPNLNTGNTLGEYDGSLANSGERLALGMPDISYTTNGLGQVSSNVVYVVVDELTYNKSGNYWPHWADGGGSSLELIDPRANHRFGFNWADSDESAKSTWTTVEAFSSTQYGGDSGTHFEILAQGDGEYLVDNAEVFAGSAGANLLTLANSTLDSGIGGWAHRGTHIRSTWSANGGVNNSGCLHVRASDRGDSIANRNVCLLTTPLPITGTATIRAQVRWLKGWPELLLRTHGNYIEAFGRLNIPTNLGTPGQRNSRAANNAPPAIDQVKHNPVVPASGEAVVVTARVHDPDGATLTLLHRVDGVANYTSAAMLDNGAGGDAVAGDGLYSATIPGQAAGVLVAFQVRATDGLNATSLFPVPNPTYTNPFECLVRFGDLTPAGAFGTYRQWMTAANVNTWANRPALSNEKLYGTFVYGNFRAVYNMTVKWNGSPYHQFGGAPGADGHYSVDLPVDDQVLGTDSFHKLHMPGNGPGDDNTIQREQTAYWFARQLGLPYNYRRNVNMIFNGNRRGGTTSMMEDTETPGNEVVNSRFPDDRDGNLFKLQPWFEQPDGTGRTVGGANNLSWCLFTKFQVLSNGVQIYKTARYRNNFLTRAANDTANEYEPVFTLLDALNTPTSSSGYAAAVENLIDVEEWTRIWAVCHGVGDWDHVGTQNAQNMYAYKPQNGKWTLMIWDLNIVLGNSGSWGAGVNLVGTYTGGETALAAIYAHPPFRRMYFRALKELANGPMAAANVDPVMDAKYNAFVASGITPTAPATAVKGDIQARRTAILNTVAGEDAAAFALTVTNQITTSNNLVTITGNAPVEMKTLRVNGVEYPLTWTSVRAWTLRLVATSPSNFFSLQGVDVHGNSLPGFSANVRVNYTGPVADPTKSVVINEIMYKPVVPNASYVEIYNTSPAFAFDLSGWRFSGLSYTFPTGTVLTAGQYLLLAKNRSAVFKAFTNSIPVFAEFDGNLDPEGETLTLIKPGATAEEDVIVDRVRYEAAEPWASGANGTGASLQLIDARQDNSRVSEWSDGKGWKFFSFSGTPTTNVFMFYMTPTGGELYIDDVYVCEGTVPEAGPNLIQNGGFEAPFAGTWNTNLNTGGSFITTDVSHSGSAALRLHFRSAGGTLQTSFTQTNLPVTTGVVHTISFWYTFGTNGSNLRTTLSGTSPVFNQILNIAPLFASPGAVNNAANTLQPYDPVWLNEVLVSNSTGTNDNFGEREPWIELYNGGTDPIDLSNYFMSDNYSDLTQWAFPPGTILNPGHRVVWADGEAGETSGAHLHTSFRLTGPAGSVVLSRRLLNSAIQIVDYLNYSTPALDTSYGDFPDGQPFTRQVFYGPTPGATNTAPPISVFINEWLASNQQIPDPDGDYDDWFELFNSHSFAVDISGYHLTDSTNNKTQFRIPNGTTIPAGGHLVIWADGDDSTNGVHANFNLSRTSDSIYFYEPDGVTLIDSVTFSNQVSNVSEGRYPDGTPTRHSFITMTPGSANTLGAGNTAPNIPAISDKTVTLGQTLSFTVTATDSDNPAQTLSFSLDAAPPGASIGASSGLFSWTPTPGQVPSTNNVTVRVTDNGSPAMSATRSFTVRAFPPPTATITYGAGSVSLAFSTTPGKTYRVEYRNDLNAGPWTPLGQPAVANGNSLNVNDTTIVGQPQRFYRIVQLD